jgi:formate hydrogenlyase transcriptional activator
MPEEPALVAERTCPQDCCEPEIETVSRKRCLYELLLKVADLSVGRSVADLVQEIAPPVQRITGCDFVDFSLYDSQQNCFTTQFRKSTGESGELKPRAVSESISAWVWTQQQPLVVPDLAGEQRFPEGVEELRTHGVRSYIALPMTTSLRRFGVLGLGRYQLQVPDPRGLEFLSRITRMATLALENQETMRAWKEQRERLQDLVTLSRELSSMPEVEKLVPMLFTHLRRIMQHDHTIITLLQEDGKTARLHAVDAPSWEQLGIQEQVVPLEELPSARAIQTRQTTFLTAEDLQQKGALGRSVARCGIRSVCCVPLIAGGRVWGALSLGSTRREAFSEEDGEYLQQVANQLAAALENAQAYREIADLKDRLAQEKTYLESEIDRELQWDEIVGTSAGWRRILEAAAVVARTDATVLITGETGTGKERVARIIHAMSTRRERSFIKLNCAAIPTGLLESELFGHEKGAFTGAVSQKIGRLELADRGTLFLDEIGDIPLELQPKLLRVLQDYEFERLGGTRTIRVNVRLIAATNRDLPRAVEEKQFRRDLFYRLHVFPIHLPALRERREDIPLLVRHFVGKCAARLCKRVDIIPDQVIEAMMKWDWPGNIRELENFVERSVILSQSRTLRPPLAELQPAILEPATAPDDTLRSREREHIIQVLRQTHGMLSGPSGAAARLGLKRTTLQYRMQKLGISRVEYLD